MLNKIISVPKVVQNAVLTKYLKGCMELGRTAFYQWRLHYVNHLHDNDKILEWMLKEHFSLRTADSPELSNTKEFVLPTNFIEKYQLTTNEKAFCIQQLSQIGISDPCPELEAPIPQVKKKHDLVYSVDKYSVD